VAAGNGIGQRKPHGTAIDLAADEFLYPEQREQHQRDTDAGEADIERDGLGLARGKRR
jgi:hypothetical protein